VLNGVETGNFSKVYSREEKEDIRKRYGIKDGPCNRHYFKALRGERAFYPY